MRKIHLVLSIAAMFAASITAQAAQFTITGTVINSSVAVNDLLGVSGNPTFGLDFKASGAITYNYSFTFDAGLAPKQQLLPYALTSGSTVTFTPYLQLESGTLTATQNLNYGTSLNFSINEPYLGGTKGFSLDFPSGDLEYDWVNMTLGGDRQLDLSGSTLTGGGSTGVSTTAGSTSAWSAGLDLIAVAATYVPCPYCLIPRAFNEQGMDLSLGLGLDILRGDYLFISPDTLPSYNLTIPTLTDGTPFTLTQDASLSYDLMAYSPFDYRGSLGLSFDLTDLPFIGTDPIDLINIALGDGWYVGAAKATWDDLNWDGMLFTDELTIGQTVVGRISEPFCCVYPPDLTPNMDLPFGTRLSSSGLTVNVPTIPEPSSIALISIGLAGLAARRRKSRC